MKLQPNYSWQKYEGKPEDQKEQFQYQLMQQHVSVANTTNATIDDLSFWTRERQTSYTWVNSQPIWTITAPTVAWVTGGTFNNILLNIVGNFTPIDFVCVITNGTLSRPVPYVWSTLASDQIALDRNGTHIYLNSAGTDYSAWSGFVTVYYYKT